MAWYSRFIPEFRRRSTSPSAEHVAIARMPRIDTTEVLTELGMYDKHPTVHMSTNLLAYDCSIARLQVRTRLDDGTWAEIVGHPAIALISDPNPIWTRFELLAATVISLITTGNAYWFLAGRGSTPEEIWFLPVEYVRVDPDPVTYLKGYVYEPPGKFERFHHFEIVHFRLPNIRNWWYGRGMFLAAVEEVAGDWAASRMARSFFEDSAIPPGAWTLPYGTSDAEMDEFVAKLEERQRGRRRTPVTRNGPNGEGVRFDPAGTNQRESQYTEYRDQRRQTILETSRVPSGVLSEASTEAHARVSERFLAKFVHVLLHIISTVLTKDFLVFWGGDEMVFEDVRTVDAQQVLWRRQAMEGILDRDEMRWELYGKEPYQGDELDGPTNGSPERETESEVRAPSN